ncbi:unnamed protein product [Heligmosomoides polygyrus]|uniref:Ras-associating domain-containing protein n=1 Tax=Heligmosomoides polygyrus TaxID=6339 RepID=A0A183FVK8_HELPZ|nr:unnamed protein product [Heligmosomoides polygyrus]
MAFTLDNSDSKSVASDWHGMELLVGENSSRGTTEGLAQMLQLMSWFSAAGYIDWVFLICVVSRDAVQLRREINAEPVKKAGLEAFKHTLLGCNELIEWASQDCHGYVSIFQLFAGHLDIVAEAAGLPRRSTMKRRSLQRGRSSLKKAAPFNLDGPPSERLERPPRATEGNPKLQQSFGVPDRQVRGRSRSVDRGTDYVVSSTEEDNQSCAIT